MNKSLLGRRGTVELCVLWGPRGLQAHEFESCPWSKCKLGFLTQGNGFLAGKGNKIAIKGQLRGGTYFLVPALNFSRQFVVVFAKFREFGALFFQMLLSLQNFD
ncbi:hypothetical protein E2C01_010550 [Portunus trituberculatus]|uniref:Uncharacterized protein n=1 Tax=Portunus trituberculatus TaxID=210409 RepID=A0A5B7D929_PORTR|nr:hypothetical protein [Portunus trituberculatus]